MIPFVNDSELRSFKIVFKLILFFCRIFFKQLFSDVRRKLKQIIKTYNILPGSILFYFISNYIDNH